MRTRTVMLGACAAVMIGCVSLSTTVPPVESLPVSSASHERLRQGRDIYLTSCIACHGPYPVRGHDADAWAAILPEMIDYAGLEAEEAAVLREYLHAAR